MNKINYILKRDCPNINKEEGDPYSNEYAETIKELIEKGIIEEAKEDIEFVNPTKIEDLPF